MNVKIRTATFDDVDAIYGLIKPEVFTADGRGSVLWVPEDKMRERVEDGRVFVAVAEYEKIAGTASLIIYNGTAELDAIAELATFVVGRDYRGKNTDTDLVSCIKDVAREAGFSELHALTYRPRVFARRYGFEQEDRLPQKIAQACINCPLYNNGCKEYGVVARL